MDILFLHQNFPGQFLTLAPALVAAGHRVAALTAREGLPTIWRGVRIFRYKWARPQEARTHRWTAQFNLGVARGEAVYRAGLALRAKGLEPDVIVAHTGWGEALYVRDVWHRARLASFSELWYLAEGGDIGFDPEFPPRDPLGLVPLVRTKNALQAMQIDRSHALFSATEWQASTYPDAIRKRMAVLHEGVDTQVSRPNSEAVFTLKDGRRITREDRVISFVNRNLEPLRGVHMFLRALPGLLAEDPDAQVVVVGGDGVSYGGSPAGGGSWKDMLLREIVPMLPEGALERIHFTGLIPHNALTALFQVTRAHVYLTYPFVPGWSLLEAMSCAAPIVANNVAPVEEFVSKGETGHLVDFFDRPALIKGIRHLLDNPDEAEALGQAARNRIQNRYDLAEICLPQRIDFIDSLGGSEPLFGDPELSRTG